LLIPDITKNYDDVTIANKKSEGKTVLKYKKEIGDEYHYYETISNPNKKELRTKTMWITKKKN